MIQRHHHKGDAKIPKMVAEIMILLAPLLMLVIKLLPLMLDEIECWWH
jgi:hypothetical protein